VYKWLSQVETSVILRVPNCVLAKSHICGVGEMAECCTLIYAGVNIMNFLQLSIVYYSPYFPNYPI